MHIDIQRGQKEKENRHAHAHAQTSIQSSSFFFFLVKQLRDYKHQSSPTILF